MSDELRDWLVEQIKIAKREFERHVNQLTPHMGNYQSGRYSAFCDVYRELVGMDVPRELR